MPGMCSTRTYISDVGVPQEFPLLFDLADPIGYDGYQDTTERFVWRWELRSLKHLPRDLKDLANQARQLRKQVVPGWMHRG